MADLVDEAQARDLAFTAAAIRKRRRPLVCTGSPEPRDCVDCDDPIPTERLAAYPAATRCIDCQRGLDNRLRQFAWARR